MDEYLTDNEQVERLKLWWRENGWYLIGGVALGALLLFGWNQYGAYQDRHGERAADVYQSVKTAIEGDNTAEATTLLARMRDEYPTTSYTAQAGLLVARALLISEPERAADELRHVMDNADERELALIARLRLARVLAYREQYDEALRVLTVEDPGQFAARFNEARGDIHVSQGNAEAARIDYLTAMTSPGAEALDRNFLQMKIGDLPSSAASTSGAAPAVTPPAVAPVEAPAADASAPAADTAPVAAPTEEGA